ncbi:MAG: hypothetical protein Kow0081_3040 [Candidatus Dojkabacteria bacterium]
MKSEGDIETLIYSCQKAFEKKENNVKNTVISLFEDCVTAMQAIMNRAMLPTNNKDENGKAPVDRISTLLEEAVGELNSLTPYHQAERALKIIVKNLQTFIKEGFNVVQQGDNFYTISGLASPNIVSEIIIRYNRENMFSLLAVYKKPDQIHDSAIIYLVCVSEKNVDKLTIMSDGYNDLWDNSKDEDPITEGFNKLVLSLSDSEHTIYLPKSHRRFPTREA